MSASSFQPIVSGTALTDADVTKNPGTDGVAEYVFPPASFLSANRVLTLGTGGSPATKQVVRIIRQDIQAYTYTVKDDLAATLYVFPASPTSETGASFYFDGTHWKFLSAYRVTGNNRDGRGTNIELDSQIRITEGEYATTGYYRITSNDDPFDGYINWASDTSFATDKVPDGGLVTFYNALGFDIDLPHMAGGYSAATNLPLINLDGETVVLPVGYMIQYRLDLAANPTDGAWVQVSHPRGVSEAHYQRLAASRIPKAGTDLTDANETVQPFTDKASQYTQAVALTASRNKTLGVTTVVTGTVVRIVREDTAAFTMPIINGGGSAGTLFTFAATPTEKQAATFYYNGTDWVLVGFEYLAS